MPGWVPSQERCSAHHYGIRPAVCPTLASTKVSSHPFPGAGESGKSTIVKQMK